MRAPSRRWLVGWSLGAGVVGVAAALLGAITGLARLISRRSRQIEAAIDGARTNTETLFELTSVNLALDRTARGLAARERER